MMSDDELAEFLGIAKAKRRAEFLAAVTPGERELYESMAQAERLLKIGIVPPGAIVCSRRKR